MKRQMLTLEGWDDSSVKIPMPKYSYWFRKSRANHCVVGCRNTPNVVYISDYGYASMAYCEAHAELRILFNVVNGYSERGLWVQCRKGKLETIYGGYNIVDTLLKTTNSSRVKINLKKLQTKLKQFKRDHKK